MSAVTWNHLFQRLTQTLLWHFRALMIDGLQGQGFFVPSSLLAFPNNATKIIVYVALMGIWETDMTQPIYVDMTNLTKYRLHIWLGKHNININTHKMHIHITCMPNPVLNIGRVGRDIVRYLLFCPLPTRYGEIVRHIVCSKKWPIFEISADKLPDKSPDIK